MVPAGVMYLAVVCAIVAIVFNIVVLISFHDDVDVIKNLEWSHGSQKSCSGSLCTDIYVSVYKFISKAGGTTITTDWDGNSCLVNYCDDCEETGKGVIAFVAVAFALGLPSIFTNIERARGTGNTQTNKLIGAITSFFAMVCAAIAIIWFSRGCQKYINSDTKDDFKWKYGPAWILMLVTTLLQFINFLTNALTPAGDDTSYAHTNTNNPHANVSRV